MQGPLVAGSLMGAGAGQRREVYVFNVICHTLLTAACMPVTQWQH
jgi:uncharacterized membrane protein YozB (DUF420 family)